MKRPAWAMRNCSVFGCHSIARAECQAWDNRMQRLCRVPLCDWHQGKRGGYIFCPDHRTGAGSTAPKSQPIQAGLFEPPEF